MLLCLDVGNSQIFGGLFNVDQQLVLRFRLSSKAHSSDEFGIFLLQVLRENAVDALKALASRQLNEAFEHTVEASVLLSGLAFESGGLSIAHALTRGLSAVADFSNALHGEQVAYGLIVQRVVERASEGEMRDLSDFMADVGLPRNLRELAGKECASAEIIDVIAERTVRDASHHLRHFSRPIARTDLIEAMRVVENASLALRR